MTTWKNKQLSLTYRNEKGLAEKVTWVLGLRQWVSDYSISNIESVQFLPWAHTQLMILSHLLNLTQSILMPGKIWNPQNGEIWAQVSSREDRPSNQVHSHHPWLISQSSVFFGNCNTRARTISKRFVQIVC